MVNGTTPSFLSHTSSVAFILCQFLSSGGRGKHHPEYRSLARLAGHPHAAMMTQDNAVNCCQAQTASNELRAEEWIEYPLPRCGVHAAAGVLDFHVRVRARRKTPAQDVSLQRSGIEILPPGTEEDPAPLCPQRL